MALPPASPVRRPALGLAALLLLATLAATLAASPVQAKYTYGSIVDKNDDDFTAVASVKVATLCFADVDGDGAVASDEPLYLAKRATCGTVAPKDIRLADESGYAAGSEAKALDADGLLKLAPVPAHAVRFVEGNGADGKVRKVDTVYVDLTGLEGKRVGVGDLRVSAFGALPGGRRVQGGDADLNMPLAELPGAPACAPCTFATANLLVEIGKGTYLNMDRDAPGAGTTSTGFVEEGDVRLTTNVPSWTNDLGGAPLKFTLTGMSLPASLPGGQAFQVTGTVTNTDSVPGTATLETRLDDVLVDVRAAPLLMPAKTATVVLTLVSPTEPGIHTVRLGDSAVAFNVLKPATPAVPEAPATSTGTATGTASTSASATGTPTGGLSPAVASAGSVGAPAAGLPVAVLGLAVVAGALLRRSA